jgi:hypothetical protein
MNQLTHNSQQTIDVSDREINDARRGSSKGERPIRREKWITDSE